MFIIIYTRNLGISSLTKAKTILPVEKREDLDRYISGIQSKEENTNSKDPKNQPKGNKTLDPKVINKVTFIILLLLFWWIYQLNKDNDIHKKKTRES